MAYTLKWTPASLLSTKVMLFNDFDISGTSSKVPIFAGHMILNTVDCTRPNGGRLPQSVDLMMSDFAGGASGFPMTFYGGKYSGNFCSVVFFCFFTQPAINRL